MVQKISQNIGVIKIEAIQACQMLAENERIFAGMSSGASLAAALKYASVRKATNIIVIFPDRGEKYHSTGMFS